MLRAGTIVFPGEDTEISYTILNTKLPILKIHTRNIIQDEQVVFMYL